MAYKITVLGMLITLHSLGLIFASLFTFKWYVDNYKDIGIFGICEYLNGTSINRIMSLNNKTKSLIDTKLKTQINNLSISEFYTSSEPWITQSFTENIFDLRMAPNEKQQLVKEKTDDSYSFVSDAKIYQKCNQLLWPDSDEALEYLSTKPTYLTVMMGVGISSASLGILTFIWSCVCVIFQNVGAHPRAGELLVVLSILTDLVTIASFGLFMGKDARLYPFKFYGISFWLSVAASCGFFITSILFAVNRINIGFKYMLRNYQSQFSES